MTHVSRPLRWGAVGGGDATSVGALHRNALRLNGDTELVAGVFSHDREKSKRLGAELGVDEDRIYPSAEVMAAREAERADGIDFVDISTPKGHPEGLTEAFANIYSAFTDAIRDRQAGTLRPEGSYGYPTLAMGVAGVRFFNACVDSQELGNVWVTP